MVAGQDQNRSRDIGNSLAASPFVSGVTSTVVGGVLLAVVVGSWSPGAITTGLILLIAFGAGVTVHYWTIFGYGDFAKGSQQRARYNLLRTRLRTGGHIGPVYERMLRAALDGIDRFFGDGDQARRAARSGASGPAARVPLWTANSYDRCLLIALAYPIAALFVVWVASGHVGPGETIFGLPHGMSTWRRGLALAFWALCGIVWYRGGESDGLRAGLAWVFAGIVAGVGGFVTAGGGLGTLAVLLAIAAAVFMVARLRIAALFAAIIGSLVPFVALVGGVLDVSFGFFLIIVFGGSLVCWAAAIGLFHLFYGIEQWAEARGWHGWFLTLWTVAALLAVFSPLPLVSSLSSWRIVGPFLFFILLTLVNAPFDWITLGLTRMLLRRGLDLGGWWPLVFGLIDLAAAAAVVTALSVATLWSVQLFGHFTDPGGMPILDIPEVLGALGDPARRGAPEFWWLYAMLFSTLIPSIVNVALGALSLMRGLPGLHNRLARRMPVGKAVLDSERIWMAPLLAAQLIASVVIGTAVMLGLIYAVLIWEMPFVGLNLVSMLQALAAEDVPGRLLAALGIG